MILPEGEGGREEGGKEREREGRRGREREGGRVGERGGKENRRDGWREGGEVCSGAAHLLPATLNMSLSFCHVME